MSLKHRTTFINDQEIAVKLPFTKRLQEIHEKGDFPLLEDPLTTQKAIIIGMFVLRPGVGKALEGEVVSERGVEEAAIYDEYCDWAYNLDGIDGGWLIANLNSVDAYRLGLQYALSDAVMVGSNTVCAEGVSSDVRTGYVWQPYQPFSWPSVASIDAHVLEKALEQRKLWQDLGYLSPRRRYPAQIIITNTGRRHDNSPDFLEGHVFTAKHPTGEPLEVYILTTEIGAARVRERAADFGLADRITDMLIVLPSLPNQPERMDLTSLPSLLFQRYEMKIVNHDGGQKVLLDFARQKVLTQMNLTLGRKINVRDVLQQLPAGIVSDETRLTCLKEVDSRVRHFFASAGSAGKVVRGVPRELSVACVIEDEAKDVAVITFNSKKGIDFHQDL